MELLQLRDGAAAAAAEAGRLLMGKLGRVGIEHKGAVDLVTEADRASERLVVERLGALLPGASILAEEGSGVERDSEWRWVVDPLDGTTNFAHGYPMFTVSIALERAGERVVGVVFDPTRDDLFHAVRGEGAFRNRERLRVSATASLDQAMLVTGFPYDVRRTRRDNLPQFARFLKLSQAVRRDGSASLNLCYLAAGRFDGYWEEKLRPWDVAAGALVVEEAGGTVTGYHGEPFDPAARHLVASNGRFHREMIAVLTGIEDGGTLPPVGEPG